MKSLIALALALAATLAAVEAKGRTKKRGLDEPILAHAHHNHLFPLGGPVELGSLHGLELESYETLLDHTALTSLGSHSFAFPDIAFSFEGADHHGLTLGGLHRQLGLLSGYANGHGTAVSTALPAPLPLPIRGAAPVSLPQPVTPAQTRTTTSTATPPPPAAYPPSAARPPAVQPPAPLTAPASTPASTPANNRLSSGGRLGSGSLGYVHLGNGLVALGSGSLGFTPTGSAGSQPANQNTGQNQPNTQINRGSTGRLHTSIIGSYGSYGDLSPGYGGYSVSDNRFAVGHFNNGLVGLNLGLGGHIGLGYGFGGIPSNHL